MNFSRIHPFHPNTHWPHIIYIKHHLPHSNNKRTDYLFGLPPTIRLNWTQQRKREREKEQGNYLWRWFWMCFFVAAALRSFILFFLAVGVLRALTWLASILFSSIKSALDRASSTSLSETVEPAVVVVTQSISCAGILRREDSDLCFFPDWSRISVFMPRARTSTLFSSPWIEAFDLDAEFSINARVSLCCDVVWSLISSLFLWASSSTFFIPLSARSSPLFVGKV